MADIKPPASALEALGLGSGSALAQKARTVANSLSDDVAAVANTMNSGGASGFNPNLVPDGNDVDNAANAAARHARAKKSKGTPEAVIGDEGAVFRATDPLVGGVSKVGEVVGSATLATDLALPVIGGAAGLVGMQGVKNTLNAPGKFLSETKIGKSERTLNGSIQDGLILGFAAINAYGVAKGFSQNLNSLKHMYAEVTGVPVEKVSTMALLTGKVPEVVAEARSHFLKEFVSRGAISAVGLGLIVRGMRKGGVGWLEGLVPTFAGMGVDMLMGESALPFFAGVSNAHKAGQQIPAEAYGEFLMAASKELKSRGNIGRRVAMLLGEEYAQEKASPTQILQEIEESLQAKKTGQKAKFDQRIDAILSRTQMEHPPSAHAHGAHGQAPHAHAEPSMVERVHGAKGRDIEVKGKFTQKLKQEMTTQEQGIVPGIT